MDGYEYSQPITYGAVGSTSGSGVVTFQCNSPYKGPCEACVVLLNAGTGGGGMVLAPDSPPGPIAWHTESAPNDGNGIPGFALYISSDSTYTPAAVFFPVYTGVLYGAWRCVTNGEAGTVAVIWRRRVAALPAIAIPAPDLANIPRGDIPDPQFAPERRISRG